MESDVSDFLVGVHNCLSLHPRFKKPINYRFTEGLSHSEACIAIWFFLGSIEHRLSISQLQFLIRVLDRQIVPKEVKITFRKRLFWTNQVRNKKFIYNLAKARRKVAREITRKRKINTSPRENKILSIHH